MVKRSAGEMIEALGIMTDIDTSWAPFAYSLGLVMISRIDASIMLWNT